MGKMPRTKMDIGNRAKQFLPFSALKGLSEALEEKERVIVPKPELSEDMLEELDQKIKQIERGNIITLTYYDHGECVKLTGMIAKIDNTSKTLQIVNTKIQFSNILSIEEV